MDILWIIVGLCWIGSLYIGIISNRTSFSYSLINKRKINPIIAIMVGFIEGIFAGILIACLFCLCFPYVIGEKIATTKKR